jgi:protein-tyrosine kinase
VNLLVQRLLAKSRRELHGLWRYRSFAIGAAAATCIVGWIFVDGIAIILLGPVVGCAAAFIRFRQRPVFFDVSTLRQVTGTSVLGVASLKGSDTYSCRRQGEEGFIPTPDQRQHSARQFRELARPMLAHAFGPSALRSPHGNLIVVSSPGKGEGRAAISFNLAMAIVTECKFSALIVDADAEERRFSAAFRALEDSGEFDLRDASLTPAEQGILQTSVPGLSFLPAENIGLDNDASLAGSSLRQLITEIAAEHQTHMVIVDAPSILQSKASKDLIGEAGQIAVVVRAGHTCAIDVIAALDAIGSASPTRLVLNLD